MDKAFRQKIGNTYLFRYVFVGVLNTAVAYFFFIVLLSAGFHYVPASLLSYIAGVGNSYVWNKYFTFRKSGIWLPEVLKFLGVYAGQYVIGLACLALLVEVFRLGPIPAQAIVLVISVAVTFFAHRHWTFKTDRHPAENRA